MISLFWTGGAFTTPLLRANSFTVKLVITFSYGVVIGSQFANYFLRQPDIYVFECFANLSFDHRSSPRFHFAPFISIPRIKTREKADSTSFHSNNISFHHISLHTVSRTTSRFFVIVAWFTSIFFSYPWPPLPFPFYLNRRRVRFSRLRFHPLTLSYKKSSGLIESPLLSLDQTLNWLLPSRLISVESVELFAHGLEIEGQRIKSWKKGQNIR